MNTITPITSTINGNLTIVEQGNVVNPECAFIWSDNTNYRAALILPTDANGQLQAAGMGALTGDVTGTAGSYATTVTKINNTAFAGTSGHLVSFGAANIPADSGVVGANVTTQTSNGAANELCTYTGANKVCVPGVATNAMLQNYSTTVNGEECDLGGTCSITAGVGFPATVTGITTSGGIPYFSDTVTLTSSGLLCTQCLVLGGGAGGSPATGNGDFTYATHTLASGASGLFDLHAITSTSGFKVPVKASETAAAAGVLDFDSTNTNYHGYVNGADSIFLNIPSAPTTGDLFDSAVSSGNTLAHDSGIATANVVTQASNGAAGQIATYTGSNKALVASATPTLGASGTLGSMTFGNATSGTLTLEPAAGAITGTVLIPSGSDTLVSLTGTQTLTNKTLTTAALGSSTASTQTAGDNSTKVATTAYTNIAYNLVHTSGSPYSMAGLSGFYWNNTASTYSWTLDAPVAGKQYCFGNYSGRSGVLTITSTTSVYIVYEGTNGTVTTGTLVSGGAKGDFVCMEGVDTTHYMVTGAGFGTWTNN